MSYQRINGPPELVERRTYGNLAPRAMGGFWDTVIQAVKGGSDVYQATKTPAAAPEAAPVPQYAPPPPQSTFQKYLPALAIGGLAIGAIVLLRKK